MLLPKQSAIWWGWIPPQSEQFWTCFYRSNLLSLVRKAVFEDIRFEHASTEAICYRLCSQSWRSTLVLNMLLPKQSAIRWVCHLIASNCFEHASTEAICYPDSSICRMQTAFWTCFYRSNLLSYLGEATHLRQGFEHASTEAICYLSDLLLKVTLRVLNMLLPKQSAIESARAVIVKYRFWTCFYRSNLLSGWTGLDYSLRCFEHASTEAICYHDLLNGSAAL